MLYHFESAYIYLTLQLSRILLIKLLDRNYFYVFEIKGSSYAMIYVKGEALPMPSLLFEEMLGLRSEVPTTVYWLVLTLLMMGLFIVFYLLL